MKLSKQAQLILNQLSDKNTKLGDVRKIAKEIKKDHLLAIELWSTKLFFPRQLAILLMDKKLLTEDSINQFVDDINLHEENEKLQLIDWLMANQLIKDKRTIEYIENWKESTSSLQRRVYWYYKGRLRWMGKIYEDSEELLSTIENQIANEPPEVQWADRKSTRLNSSHVKISYAVFCLKKKRKIH